MLQYQIPLLYLAGCCYLAAVLGYLGNLRLASRRLAGIALTLVACGWLAQSGSLLLRWQAAGFLPVTNLFSTQFFFSWSLALTYLYFDLRYRIGAAGLFVMFVNLLLIASILPRDPAIPALIPSLDTPLFTLHIIFSFTGYAMFTMAFSIGVLYLWQQARPTRQLPDLVLLRKLNEEAVFLGFCLFSACMLFGAIWAYIAWGYYFSWNIKSVWSFIVWLFYAGMCHAKFVRRWQGRGYAILSILGFAVVLFTYLGIGLLLESNHPLD
ncbi:cytochrome c biogenesis protein CcsA [Geothermobacter hydrogeniphilus]|nr:cytochrome c biogenesis protein CcsA [Geothermobacter hydrogeniphilus]